jgi:hypothetical protein
MKVQNYKRQGSYLYSWITTSFLELISRKELLYTCLRYYRKLSVVEFPVQNIILACNFP